MDSDGGGVVGGGVEGAEDTDPEEDPAEFGEEGCRREKVDADECWPVNMAKLGGISAGSLMSRKSLQ